jgi:hypothetical protein
MIEPESPTVTVAKEPKSDMQVTLARMQQLTAAPGVASSTGPPMMGRPLPRSTG